MTKTFHEKIFDVSNKVIVLTGSAGRVGSHFCNILANAGANLILVDKDRKILILKKELEIKFKVKVFAIVGDITNLASTLSVKDNTFLKNNLQISGNTNISKNLDVGKNTNLAGTLSISGNTNLSNLRVDNNKRSSAQNNINAAQREINLYCY